MADEHVTDNAAAPHHSRSSGPLTIYTDENNKLFVTGFGLWIPVESEKEGRLIIEELENQGYRMCY